MAHVLHQAFLCFPLLAVTVSSRFFPSLASFINMQSSSNFPLVLQILCPSFDVLTMVVHILAVNLSPHGIRMHRWLLSAMICVSASSKRPIVGFCTALRCPLVLTSSEACQIVNLGRDHWEWMKNGNSYEASFELLHLDPFLSFDH